MAVRGRTGGRPDPESMLDAAMAESIQEIASKGSGVEVEDVVRAPAPRRDQSSQGRTRPQRGERQERGQSRAADDNTPRDEQGRFVSSRADRRSSQEVDPYEVLGEPQDDADDERTRRRTSQRRRASAPPVYNDQYADDLEDADEDDEYEADDDRVDARRRRAPDEDEDDDLDPEGGYDLEDADEEVDGDEEPRTRGRAQDDDEEDDEEEGRGRRRRGGSRQKRFSKRIEREIGRAVEKRVGQVIAQNEQMAQEQARRKQIDDELGTFMMQALGTPERKNELKAIAYNTRLPQAQRDKAINELAIYDRNAGYFEKYKTAAEVVIRANQAADVKAAVQAMAELRPLDPKIVAEGNNAKTMIHAYATGRALGQSEGMAEIKRLRRLLANARGERDERRPSRISDGRRSSGRLPSASGRRANGRVGRGDPLSGSMERVRGIGANSSIPMPTEEILRQLRDKETTFERLGMGRVRVG